MFILLIYLYMIANMAYTVSVLSLPFRIIYVLFKQSTLAASDRNKAAVPAFGFKEAGEVVKILIIGSVVFIVGSLSYGSSTLFPLSGNRATALTIAQLIGILFGIGSVIYLWVAGEQWWRRSRLFGIGERQES